MPSLPPTHESDKRRIKGYLWAHTHTHTHTHTDQNWRCSHTQDAHSGEQGLPLTDLERTTLHKVWGGLLQVKSHFSVSLTSPRLLGGSQPQWTVHSQQRGLTATMIRFLQVGHNRSFVTKETHCNNDITLPPCNKQQWMLV